MSNGCTSPSPLAATVRILFLSTNSNRLPSGEKLGKSPAPTLCGTPPAVATTHTSLGITPSGELLTLAGVSSSRLWPRVKAIDFVSGDQASLPIAKPSSSVYGVIRRAFAPWGVCHPDITAALRVEYPRDGCARWRGQHVRRKRRLHHIVECKSRLMGGLCVGQRCGHPEHRQAGDAHHHSTHCSFHATSTASTYRL